MFAHQFDSRRLVSFSDSRPIVLLCPLAAIKRMLFGDWSVWAEYPHIRRGLPSQGRGWRWTAHEDKLTELQSLCRQAFLELLGE